MYKCLNCGAEFETPEVEVKYFNSEIDDHINICPECKIDDIEELHLCSCQRKYIADKQDRCDQCEAEISEAMQQARQIIMNARNVDYQTASNDMVWWIEREG